MQRQMIHCVPPSSGGWVGKGTRMTAYIRDVLMRRSRSSRVVCLNLSARSQTESGSTGATNSSARPQVEPPRRNKQRERGSNRALIAAATRRTRDGLRNDGRRMKRSIRRANWALELAAGPRSSFPRRTALASTHIDLDRTAGAGPGRSSTADWRQARNEGKKQASIPLVQDTSSTYEIAA